MPRMAKKELGNQVNTPEVTQDCGLRWLEFNKADQLVAKQKFFRSESALTKFVLKLAVKNNFCRIDAVTR